MKPWITPAAVAFFCWGVWAFLPKVTTRFIDPRSAVIFEIMGAVLVGLGLLATVGFRLALDVRGVAPAVATGFLGVAGALAYLYAVLRGPVSLIATVTALYPILSILLAAWFLNETLTIRQGVGILFGFLAILLIGG